MRQFSVEEANGLIPTLTAALVRIKEARQVVLRGAERVKRLSRSNGSMGAEYRSALETLRRDVEELTAQGIVLRDADKGLVDFPSLRDGQEVFLCWRLGEERVGHWHGPDSGFAGRRPL